MNVPDAIAELKGFRFRQLFVPFVIALNDGRRLPVNRPLQFAVQPWVGIVLDERDRLVRFDPADVVAIEVVQPVK